MPLDATNAGGPARNVLGGPLRTCSLEPLTGWTRTGCCETGPGDAGSHTVCAVVTEEFLAFSRARGNDLSTPHPEFGFPASCRVTAGACAPRVGRRHWKVAPRRAWCWRRRTRPPCCTAAWTT